MYYCGNVVRVFVDDLGKRCRIILCKQLDKPLIDRGDHLLALFLRILTYMDAEKSDLGAFLSEIFLFLFVV